MENKPSIRLIFNRNIFQKPALAVQANSDPLDRMRIARTRTQRTLEGHDDIVLLNVTMTSMDARMNPDSHAITPIVSYRHQCSTKLVPRERGSHDIAPAQARHTRGAAHGTVRGPSLRLNQEGTPAS